MNRSLPARPRTAPETRGVAGVIGAAMALLLLAGCSGSPASGPRATGSSAVSGASASGGSSTSVPTATGTAPAPSAAASTAGDLSGKNVPSSLGSFTPAVATPDDEEHGGFVPNGTPVRALDPAYAATEALPACSSAEVKVPRATHGIAATYSYKGKPGSLIVLDFNSETDAKAWFSAFTTLVRACPRVGAEPVITATTVTDRRESAGSVWTEAGFVKGSRATMGSVQSADQDPTQLLGDVRSAR
ncbi:hypothetical protein [Acidipropionibacterium virtanenii]|uniref:hypothetical protein n=1 Tax=Acidipropionibacterium virtanenii TaxID=2057246 RepID=UPI0011BF8F00|nr:hypothetical protein [Acidipropionibacterium virtanenii]